MATESDAVLATIVDNWGNGGYGGATPKIQSTADISVDRWAALDAVIVLHDTLDERHPPLNDKYVDKEFTMDIRVTSITSEDQLKLLVEEVEYLLNNTAITGFTSCRIIRKWRGSSDRKRKVYRNDITIELWTRVSSSAIAPDGGTFAGPTTLSSLVFSDGGSTVDIIRDEDDIASDDAAALATQQSIKAYADAILTSPNAINIKPSGDTDDYLAFSSSGTYPIQTITGSDHYLIKSDDATYVRQLIGEDMSNFVEMGWHKGLNYGELYSTHRVKITTVGNVAIDARPTSLTLSNDTDTITLANIADLLMFGSANAAWVPCIYIGNSGTTRDYYVSIGTGFISNLNANDAGLRFDLPLPTNKGGLKLYISGSRVVINDADGDDYIDTTTVYGYTHTGLTNINQDATNYDSQATHDDTFTAVDSSSYSGVFVFNNTVVTNANDLDIAGVLLRCYYAT